MLDVTDPSTPSIEYTTGFSHSRLRGRWQNGRFHLRGFNSIFVKDRDLNTKVEIPTRGRTGSFVLTESILFASTNIGIEIYDITDESLPVLRSIYGANIARPVEFSKQDNLLYIANLGDGLKIVDVLNKHQPTLLGGIDFDGYTLDVKVKGNYAYLADYIKGLIIIDVSQSSNPRVVSTLPIDGGAVALDLMENEAFIISDNNELFAIDLSDKDMPQITYKKEIVPQIENWYGDYKKIAVTNSKVWVKFVDSPLYAFEYSAETGFSEVYRHDYEYYTHPREIKYIDNYLYLVTYGIQILDPISLTFIREEPFGVPNIELEPFGVALDQSAKILYVILGAGVRAYDVTTPENPEPLEDSWGGMGVAPMGIIFEEGYLYTLRPHGIGIYTPSNIAGLGERAVPKTYNLAQNYPNPFNPSTRIEFDLPHQVDVTLKVYNIMGSVVTTLANNSLNPGYHRMVWDGRDSRGRQVPSGIYIARLITPDFSKSIKMVLMK